MSLETLAGGLRVSLIALGVLFLVVNVRAGLDLWRWWRRRSSAVAVWLPPKPPYYGLNLAIGVMLGLILLATVLFSPRPGSVFGELMMFVYYGYLLPLSTKITRGIYRDGVWTDSGFMPYADIGGLSWKDGASTLVIASRLRAIARTLSVPGARLGEVRRLLREKIGERIIEFEGGPGLHLGTRDTRESV